MNDSNYQRNSFLLATLLFTICLPIQAFAQKSNLVFDLEPGAFTVGFKAVNQYDYSRTYQSRIDALGNERTAPRVRPIQTSIWYPAVVKENRQPMLFEEYVYLFANEEKFVELSEKSKAEAIGILKRRFPKMSESGLNNELKAKTNAFRNADAATGSFPVIIYAPSLSAPSFENSVLCEYLASHGYIVVASPDMGANSRQMTADLSGIETQVKDIRFLIGFAQNYPNADSSKLAVVGFSWGGISNVFAQMQDDRIRAVASLDGSIRHRSNLIKEAGYVDALKMNVPFLYLAQQNRSMEQLNRSRYDTSYNFFNSLKYSDAYLVTFQHLVHLDFASNFVKFRDPDPEAEFSQSEISESYQWMARYVLHFLNAYLKDNKQSLEFLNNTPKKNGAPNRVLTVERKTGQKPFPGIGEFAGLLRQSGFEKAVQIYSEAKKNNADFALNEPDVNRWGYELLQSGNIKEAIEVFKLNAEIYPQSSNVYHSLAEAYLLHGDKELAIKNYKKALELNPRNENALAKLKNLEAK